MFREDLYYRISEIVLEIPALRDREGDKVLLAKTFLTRFSQENGRSFRGFSDDALAQIESHDWPGNVRELENKIKRAVVLADGNRITAGDLGFTGESGSLSLNLRKAREEAELRVIQRALSVHNNNISHAADAIGVSRPSLYNLMKKLQMVENPRNG